jgi:hypothetical protein
MKEIVILITSIILLTSCQKDAVSSSSTSNSEIHVDLMFHLDSTYKPGVYRFNDGGYNKYFVISPYGSSTSSTEKHGKTTVTDEIETK